MVNTKNSYIANTERPFLKDELRIEMHIPGIDTYPLISVIRNTLYSFKNNTVKFEVYSSKNGSVEEIIENLDNVEYLCLLPTKDPKFFLSFLYGKLQRHSSAFSYTDQDINIHTLVFRFYDAKVIKEYQQFDSNKYIDDFHKLLYEKFMFSKV